jgi:two-component system sensor histidine kinase KdpD
VATLLREHLDPANIIMLFMLMVVVVALREGRGPAVMASFLCVALFDFFFVPPRFSFAVDDVQYVVTLAVMLAVALITAHLTADLRRHVDIAADRERETQSLYELARDLAGAASIEQVASIAEHFLLRAVGMHAILLLPDDDGALAPVERGTAKPAYLELRLAQLAYERGETVGFNALADTDQAVAYMPLKAPMRIRGSLAVAPAIERRIAARAAESLLPAVASLVAIALERLHYVDVANRAQLDMTSERLRNSILTALSHDVRTPLTALVGLADSLTVMKPPLPEAARETAAALREQAARMSGMVSNLLDMARLSAGHVTLRKEWQLLEEIVGAAVKQLRHALVDRRVAIELPALPLIEFDAVLIERVLCNLLENATKYSPAGSPITITAALADGFVHVCVANEGEGFQAERPDDLFGIFVRGQNESSVSGTGLGLAICQSIVEAHGGTIRAENATSSGAKVTFTLPLGSPPPIEDERQAVDGDALG